MNANIRYESGIQPEYVEAAELAYLTIGKASNETVNINASPLELSLPTLPSGQYDSEWIERVSADKGSSFLVITNQDIGAKSLDFCYGRSAFNRRASIVSASRITPVTMTGLALHEIGHSLGLVETSVARYDRISRFAGHCANTCVMEPINNIDEMNGTVDKMLSCPHSGGFCAECARHIANGQYI